MASCNYSFNDLFRAAFGRDASEQELLNLYALPQSERNQIVKAWAQQAGWQTQVRLGTDHMEYVAFAEGDLE